MKLPSFAPLIFCCFLILDIFLLFQISRETSQVRDLKVLKEISQYDYHLCEATLKLRDTNLERIRKDIVYLEEQNEQLKPINCEKEEMSAINRAKKIMWENLIRLQNPEDCGSDDVRFLVCDMSQAHGTGFGCQLHHFAMCLSTGWASNRTVVFYFGAPWAYARQDCDAKGPWECYFEPISKCNMEHVGHASYWDFYSQSDRSIKAMKLTFRQSMPHYKDWMPPELEPLVKEFHARPQIWYVGYLVKYLIRMNERMTQGYDELKKRLFGRKMPHPIIGLHARGDDSFTEREIIYLDYFMPHIPIGYHTIYLATDDKKNWDIAKSFTNYTWIRNLENDTVIDLNHRHQKGALESLIYDIYLLSECDHFIGSDGSQISRAVYELMQTRHVDASDMGWSIHTIKKDKRYFFWWFFI